MLSPFATHKIRSEHLTKLALIYIRQSTLAQVIKNIGSKTRQYNLVQRALDLGWTQEQIVVIDQDQGLSGVSANDREGFQFTIAQAGLGRVGAVFSLEVSRLSRSCSDWHRLIEICALTNTLVIDEENVYDPTQYDDSLILDIKGTMGAAELHWLRNRLLGGKLEKARQGKLRLPLPTGLIYDSAGQTIFDPDEEVRRAVRLVLDLFDELGSAMAVVRHFATHQILFPTRYCGSVQDSELTWKPLSHRRVLDILHNPAYAGAYAYGRTQAHITILPGETTRTEKRTRCLNPDDWSTLILDAHPGYITWDQFLRNQQQLDDNRPCRAKDHRGAAREGAALLQGIVLCGRCGRRMTIRYLDDGITPVYRCSGASRQFGGPTCQSLRGDDVDAAVAQVFLEAMQPAQLEVSIAALEQVEARACQIDQQWQLRIERAQYEADLARRRFFAVEPENRLVARSLERDWNEKLGGIERLEREYATSPRPTALLVSPEERERILALAQDLPTIWHASTTTHVERKQLLRFLIKDVTLTRRETTIHIGIRWQTGALTDLEIPRPKRAGEARRTDPTVVDRVRELAPTHTDRQIAALLNQEGLITGQGKPFTNVKVRWVRRVYNIPTGCPEAPSACPNGQRGDGRYSTQAAAELLNVSESTIGNWCKSGRLDGVQIVPSGPRWIKLTPEIITELRKPVQRSQSRRSSK
ncbi:MAG: recombinase family protein [Chloroflexi bacterium]|nr:recombinase family protein [Chloroflexota bacterium]